MIFNQQALVKQKLLCYPKKMRYDRILLICLVSSLIIHLTILSRNSNFRILPSEKKAKQVKVRYVKETSAKLISRSKAQNSASVAKASGREPLFKIPPRISMERQAPPPPFVERQKIQQANTSIPLPKAVFNKPSFAKPVEISIRRKISLPPIDVNKINNPVYISYYQVVREKIKRSAYQNYSSTETGEVTVSFLISDNGYLKDMKLVEEKSSASPYLREIAARSVKDASPFPNFPRDLAYPQLSFNLTITFEVE